MSNPLDPQSRFSVEVGGQTFASRYLTGRQIIQFDEVTDKADAAAGQAAEVKLLAEALEIADVRTSEGGAVPAEVLTVHQMWDLANRLTIAQRLDERQKKASGSPSPSATAARSATTAEAGAVGSPAV